MAFVAAAAPEIEAFFATLTTSSLAKGAIGSLIGFGIADLIKYIQANPSKKGSVPKYAIVDIHNNRTIKFISGKRVYRLLLAPRKRVPHTKSTITNIYRGDAPLVERVR